ELHDGKRPHWMGDHRSPSAFGHFGASGCFLWVDPDAGLGAAAARDREFADDKWGMATWPAWSDRLGGQGRGRLGASGPPGRAGAGAGGGWGGGASHGR